MAHVLELPTAVRDALYKVNLQNVTSLVYYSGRAKVQTGTNPDNSPIFSTTFQDVYLVPIHTRVNQSGIKITREKPIYPIDDINNNIEAGEVTINLINADGYFAVLQDGSIIDPSHIEAGQIYIQLSLGGGVVLDLFRGIIIDTFGESFGETTIKIRDEFWGAVKKPLVFERFTNLGQSTQNSYVSSTGEFINDGPEMQIANGFIQPFDAYIAFSEDGEFISTVSISERDKVDLLDITINNKSPLGLYTLEFLSAKKFRITYPGNETFYGDATENFVSEFVEINSGFWTFGSTELKGVTITFQVRNNAYCNPVSMVKNLLIKAFLQNWGDAVSNTTSTTGFIGSDLMIDWAAFNSLEMQFNSFRVFFSETNSDNNVFEKKGGDKPLNCLTVIQRLLDHIGASLLVTYNGLITVQGPFIGDAPMYATSGVESIVQESLKITTQTKVNYLTVNYGRNDNSGNLSSKVEHDTRANIDYEINEQVINLPYFKSKKSYWQVKEIACIFKRKYLNYGNITSFEMTPQFGYSITPGDRFRLLSFQQPELDWYVEVISVSKSTAYDAISIEAIRIQEPEGYLTVVGDTVICTSAIW